MNIKSLVIIACFTLLTGCSYVNNRYCCFNNRCNEYQQYTPCGSYLKHPCENLCKTCSFKEQSCHECWACIEQDTCHSEQSLVH